MSYDEGEERKVKPISEEAKQKPDRNAVKQRYRKNSLYRVALVLHKQHDADIIGKLEKEPNKSGYIKRLIRSDIKKN